jgi:hypothetical protein
MLASALRPLMTALLRRSNPRRFKRQRLIKLLSDADRRVPALRRLSSLPRQSRLTP